MRCISSYHRHCRRLLAAACFGVMAGSLAGMPVAAVVSVHSVRVADIVLVSAGSDAGLREGMVCEVSRGGREVAQVLLVELRLRCSAALIVNLGSLGPIKPGDSIQVKVLKS